jgi:hypothetical protein
VLGGRLTLRARTEDWSEGGRRFTVVAWCLLLAADLVLRFAGFNRLYRMLAWWPTSGTCDDSTRATRCAAICRAVQRARVYYPKYAWCLQAAAACTCLLRICGIRAVTVVGVRRVPFFAHAWVEVDEEIVFNDMARLRELHAVIARC